MTKRSVPVSPRGREIESHLSSPNPPPCTHIQSSYTLTYSTAISRSGKEGICSDPDCSSTMVSPIPKKGPKNAVTKYFSKLTEIDLLTKIFDRRRRTPFPRTVLVNQPVPTEALSIKPVVTLWKSNKLVTDSYGNQRKRKISHGLGKRESANEDWLFDSNQVITSKYNLFTFLPRNLLEQFRRVANIFCKSSNTSNRTMY